MSYITRNANIILLFLIVLSATALVGATVYFQTNFERINKAYDAKLEKLNAVSEELNQKESMLGSLQQNLTIKIQREQELSGKYTEVRTEKETVEKERNQLSTEKQSLQAELDESERVLGETKNSLESEKALSSSLQDQVDDLKVEVDHLKDDKDDLADEVGNLQTKVSCLSTKPDGEESTC